MSTGDQQPQGQGNIPPRADMPPQNMEGTSEGKPQTSTPESSQRANPNPPMPNQQNAYIPPSQAQTQAIPRQPMPGAQNPGYLQGTPGNPGPQNQAPHQYAPYNSGPSQPGQGWETPGQQTPWGPAPQKNRRNFGMTTLVITGLVAALLGGAISGGIVAASIPEAGEKNSSVTITNGQKTTAANAVAAKASPSVVTVGAVSGSSGGTGSGIILDKEGYIVTNAHVVTVDGKTDGVNLQVRMYDNKVYTAKLVGADPLADIAVIKVQAPNLTPATLGDSSKINVGDMAVVIGSPFGLTGTVTDGIISTKSRTIALKNSQSASDSSSSSSKVYVNVIQTDAALNQGNSGGALVNGNGEVIGVNVAIAGSGSGGSSGNGLGFAIPINSAKRVINALRKDGKASHGYLGVQVKPNAPSNLKGEDTMFTDGAAVTDVVSGSPADKAGLRKDDVITSVDDLLVEDSQALTAAVRTFAAGDRAQFTIMRGGQEAKIDVTLGEVPNR